MRIVIIGCGLLGITTAYFLRRQGCSVTVLDRCRGPALEASFANGAMLTPGLSEPWNSPGIVWNVMRWSCGSGGPLVVRPGALASMAGWGIQFLRNSRPARVEASFRANLRLAHYSRRVLRSLQAETGIQFAHAQSGTLKLFRDSAALHKSARATQVFADEHVRASVLDPAAVSRVEPAMAPIEAKLAGAIHYPDDECGDAQVYCEALASIARRAGVELLFGVTVEDLLKSGNRVVAARTSAGDVTGDLFVVAAGSSSPHLLRSVDVNLPVCPVKGYSITVTPAESAALPQLSVVDAALNVAVVPLGRRLRVAGTAEFAGFRKDLRMDRLHLLRTMLADIYPAFATSADVCEMRPWAGLRPVSADGVPFIGATAIENLYVNTGHGHLGWTLAAGSARALADRITGAPTEFPLTDYSPLRSA